MCWWHEGQEGFSVVEMLTVSLCVLLLGSIIVTAIIEREPLVEAHRAAYEAQQKHVELAALTDFYGGDLSEGESRYYYVSRTGSISRYKPLSGEYITYDVVIIDGLAAATRTK